MNSNLKMIHGENNTLYLSGKIDIRASLKLKDMLLKYGKGDEIRLDLSDVDYISSSGLKELMICALRVGKGNMKICNVKPGVADTFEKISFSSVLSYSVAETP